jgi:predicted acetyltransferase
MPASRFAPCDAPHMPQLIPPTTLVRDSYLANETDAAIQEALPTDWLEEAAADFAGFVERRRTVRELWGVPVTELWFVDGTTYIGTVMIRHRLTPALEREGGHIGYHVVPGHRRRGHATQMLAQARAVCWQLGLSRVMVTCAVDNPGSRRVIEANGAALDRIDYGEARYWLPTSQQEP